VETDRIAVDGRAHKPLVRALRYLAGALVGAAAFVTLGQLYAWFGGT